MTVLRLISLKQQQQQQQRRACLIKNLKAKREKAGLSQHGLATAAGMGRYNISLAESGHRELNKDESARITAALKKAKAATTKKATKAKKASHGTSNKKV